MKHFYLFLIIAVLTRPQLLTAQTPCTGTPASNTVIASSVSLCPGSNVTLSLLNAYTSSGIAYQWVYSTTSALGPWSPVNGANALALSTTTLNQSGWYTCVVACQNSFQTTTATPVYISIGVTNQTTTVPYFESFQVSANNVLPNCSWSASALGINCLTYSSTLAFSGNGAAAFSYSAGGQQLAFYSMGIQLQAGAVYSMNVWQSTQSFNAANNWSNFGLAVGPNQTATGSTTVAVITSPATAAYANLSNTFVVSASGIYYVRIFANTTTATVTAPYLYFDDLSITLPCSLSANAASATLIPSSSSVCAGSVVTITVNAAPSTTYAGYPAISILYTVPAIPQTFILPLTNTITLCASTRSLVFNVNPLPTVFFIANPQAVCPGNSASLTTFQNLQNTYTLFPGAISGTNFVVTPSVATNYTIVGTTTAGCVSTSSVTVGVHLNPGIQLSANSVTVCPGQSFSLDVSGAALYFIGGLSFNASPLIFPPSNASTVYTVFASSSDGCPSTALVTANIDPCTGIQQHTRNTGWSLSPNPSEGRIILSTDKDIDLSIFDHLGKKIRTITLQKSETQVLSDLSPGMYYIRDTAAGSVKTVVVTSNLGGF